MDVDLFTDRTSTGKCMVFLLSPALIFRRRSRNYQLVIYILLMSVMMFMAHAATARVIYGPLHRFHGFDKFLPQVRTAILASYRWYASSSAGASIGMRWPSISASDTWSSRSGMLHSLAAQDIWSLVLGSIAKRPLLGYGYYAFWQGLKGESANVIVGAHWVFGYAHNGILEIWLQLGLVGTAAILRHPISGDEKRLVLPSQWLLPRRSNGISGSSL